MSALTTNLRPTAATALRPVGIALIAALAMLLLFAVAFDQGQLQALVRAAAGDSILHEYFHDARHILGFPCH